MANRIITASVTGESIKLSNKIAGAAGSCNAVSLALTFDGTWDGTTKKVYFFDANGGNAVVRVLTADVLSGGVYTIPIPGEPLAKAGEITLTVKGVELGAGGVTAERVMVSATTAMKVMSAEVPSSDTAPVEPNATQTEQLQAQIDTLTSSIESIPTNVAAAAESASAAAGSAAAAEASKTAAAQSATSAAGSATTASEKATSASGSATAAANSATDADASKAAAASSASGAATSEGNAEISANTATEKATAAAASEANALIYKTAAETAKTDAINAKDAAVTAKNSAQSAASTATTANTNAQAAKAAAEDAQAAAEANEFNAEAWAVGTRNGTAVETTDEAYHNNAKWYKDQAGEIVGGDYPTKSEAQGYASTAVSTHNSASTAHSALFAAKADATALAAHTGSTNNPHGVTAAQVGADATGTAASEVSTHNVAADAHAALFAAKADPSAGFTVTLTAAGWSNLTQTVSDARLLASGCSYIVAPSADDYDSYAAAMIHAANVTAAGQMTFTCAEAPTANITVNILRIEVSA